MEVAYSDLVVLCVPIHQWAHHKERYQPAKDNTHAMRKLHLPDLRPLVRNDSGAIIPWAAQLQYQLIVVVFLLAPPAIHPAEPHQLVSASDGR